MKRFIFLLILLAIGFYAVWPALSVYAIYNGLEKEDEAVLEQKVDWPSVRASFKEAVEPLVADELKRQADNAGGDMGAITGALGSQIAPKIVNIVVDTYMTPKGLIELMHTGGKIDLNTAMAKLDVVLPGGLANGKDLPGMPGVLGDIIKDVAGGDKKIPGLGGLKGVFDTMKANKSEPQNRSSEPMPKGAPAIGLDNIKSFRFNSPTEMELSLARDGASRKPDMTAALGFKDMDWKIVKIVPHL